jgi:hypothetical protein
MGRIRIWIRKKILRIRNIASQIFNFLFMFSAGTAKDCPYYEASSLECLYSRGHLYTTLS